MTKDAGLYQSSVSDIAFNSTDYLPILIEKCRMNLNIQEFEKLEESIDELLSLDRSSIHGYIYKIFFSLVREGDLDSAQENCQKLFTLLGDKEPNNFTLMIFLSRLFSRICGRSSQIINYCIRMLEKCRKVDPLKPAPIIELGNCYFMIGDYTKAFKFYKDSASIDIDSLDPMIGTLKCQIAQNKIKEADSQLEFLLEFSSSMGGVTSQVAFLEGMLHARKHTEKGNFQQMEDMLQASNKALGNALTLHIRSQKNLPQNLHFYIELNPDYLISLANELMFHSDFNLSQIKDRI